MASWFIYYFYSYALTQLNINLPNKTFLLVVMLIQTNKMGMCHFQFAFGTHASNVVTFLGKPTTRPVVAF